MTTSTFQTNADGLRQIAGVRVWKKSDPVFSSGLAARNDESEWRRVMYDPVAASSWQALVMGVLSRGWELRPRRETPAAQELQKMGEAIIRGLVGPSPYATPGTGLMPLLWTIPRSLTEGWLPLQKVWKAGHVRYGRRAWPSIERIIAHPQEFFHCALSGELVFEGGGVTPEGKMNPPVVFGGAEAMNWSVISSRSTRSPYGDPLCSKLWPLTYVKLMHVQWRDRTARASITGTPVIHEKFGPASRPLSDPYGGQESSRAGDITDAAMQAAIDKAAEVFDRFGWIVVPRGWELDKMTDPGAGAAWQLLIDDLNTRIRLLLEGQELTAEMPASGTGSYAASKSQENTKLTYVQSEAASCAEWLQDLVGSVLRYNLDSDPDDEPLWVFGVQDQLDADKLRAFVDMGGEVDGLAVAQRPDWIIPIRAGVTEMPLRRAETAAPAAWPMLPATGETTPDAAGDQPAEKAADTALNGAQIDALKGIVADVAAGRIPRESGLALITAGFPIDDAAAAKIMGTVGTPAFVPTVTAPPPAIGRLSRASAPAGLAQTWETLTEIEDALAVQRLALARSEYGAHMAAIEAQVLELGGGEIPDPKD